MKYHIIPISLSPNLEKWELQARVTSIKKTDMENIMIYQACWGNNFCQLVILTRAIKYPTVAKQLLKTIKCRFIIWQFSHKFFVIFLLNNGKTICVNSNVVVEDSSRMFCIISLLSISYSLRCRSLWWSQTTKKAGLFWPSTSLLLPTWICD